MKSKLYFLMLCAFSGLLLGAAFGPQRIRWSWPKDNSAAILEVKYNGQLLQVGLRDDGVVVWREIMTTTNAVVVTTNSPAEREDSGVMVLTNNIMPYYYWPNTNLWYHDNKWTNVWMNQIPVEVSPP